MCAFAGQPGNRLDSITLFDVSVCLCHVHTCFIFMIQECHNDAFTNFLLNTIGDLDTEDILTPMTQAICWTILRLMNTLLLEQQGSQACFS